MNLSKTYFFLLLLIGLPSFVVAQEWPDHSTWSGTATYQKELTRITIHLNKLQGKWNSSLTLEDIGVSGWPSIKTEIKGDQISLDFPSDSGVQKMILKRYSQSLQGTWSDNRYSHDALVTLAKVNKADSTIEKRHLVTGSVGNIGVSVILPRSNNIKHYVVFTHGSGQTPRDVNRFIAERFASDEIAGVIYDKRGTGESEGTLANSSFNDLADDAVRVAEFIYKKFGASSIGFWGHSQGGWIAPLAATQFDKSKFVIISAAPMVTPAREGEWGFINNIKDRDDAQALAPMIRKIVSSWHDGVRSNDWTGFNRLTASAKQKSWFEQTGLESLNNKPDKSFTSFYRRFMDHQPLPVINDLKIPVMAIYTLDDESIDSRETLQIINSKINSNVDVRVVTYKDLNHGMRKNSTSQPLRFGGHPSDYFAIQSAFLQTLK